MPPRNPRTVKSKTYPMLQWIAAGVGFAVTSGAIGTVLWEAVQPPNPPRLTARVTETTQTSGGHVAEITVSNAGDETAGAVELEAAIGNETAHVTIDYVPGHGEARAHLQFAGDPRGVRLRIVGWAAP